MKQKFLNTIFYIIYAYVGLCTLYLLIMHFSFYSWNIPADIVVILVIVYQLTVGSNRYQISYSSEKILVGLLILPTAIVAIYLIVMLPLVLFSQSLDNSHLLLTVNYILSIIVLCRSLYKFVTH
ncbi:MAG TPA: hypothetical protein DDY12_02515 [Porphyromonadaceae bacterium]|nr:hypothetical protein [Porphyromonadaceae bacterium]